MKLQYILNKTAQSSCGRDCRLLLARIKGTQLEGRCSVDGGIGQMEAG